jgi:hypothetical protein
MVTILKKNKSIKCEYLTIDNLLSLVKLISLDYISRNNNDNCIETIFRQNFQEEFLIKVKKQ